jgi:hypothetical protein
MYSLSRIRWINTYYHTKTLTLHKVPGGNVTTSPIDVSEFDKYRARAGTIQWH